MVSEEGACGRGGESSGGRMVVWCSGKKGCAGVDGRRRSAAMARVGVQVRCGQRRMVIFCSGRKGYGW